MSTRKLSIELVGPSRPYTAGDEVHGHVVVRDAYNIESVRIVLEGRAKTRIVTCVGPGKSATYGRGRALLMRQEQMLRPLVISGTALRTAKVFPFMFVMPEKTQKIDHPATPSSAGSLSRCRYWTDWKEARGFTVGAGQHLPPTFSLGNESSDAMRNFSCYVSYAITVNVEINGIRETAIRSLRYLAAPSIPEDLQRLQHSQKILSTVPVHVNTPSLLPDRADPAPSPPKRSRFSSRHVTALKPAFTASIACSKHVCLGQPININVSLHDLDLKTRSVASIKGDNQAEGPPQMAPHDNLEVIVKRVNVTISHTTWLRTGGSLLSDKQAVITQRDAWSSARRVASPAGVLDERNNYNWSWTSMPLPYHGTPSFSTCNIGRTHEAHIRVVLECAGVRSAYNGRSAIFLHPWTGLQSRSRSSSPSSDPDLEGPEDFTLGEGAWTELRDDRPMDELPSYHEAIAAG